MRLPDDMRLAHGLHLASCPDTHPGETWAETFAVLRGHVLALRDHVGRPGGELGLGLRLGDRAARELSVRSTLTDFRHWLTRERCYVFTLDEPSQDRPDWTDPARLAHACRLVDLLGELLPADVAGSVSTSPGSFGAFAEPARLEEALRVVYANLIHAAVHAAEAGGRSDRALRLALEPGPTGILGNTVGTIRFLEPLVDAFPDQFGVCCDVGRGAAGPAEPVAALTALEEAEIPVVKLRLGASVDVPAGVFDWLAADPTRCSYLEIGAGSREVLPPDGLAREYAEMLTYLQARGLA